MKWYAMIDKNSLVSGYTETKNETDECTYVEISDTERKNMIEGNLKNGLVYYYENNKIIEKKQENEFTKEELMEQKIEHIIEYEKLAADKKVIESSKFSTKDEIEAITEKMTVLEGYINTLSDKIKLL